MKAHVTLLFQNIAACYLLFFLAQTPVVLFAEDIEYCCIRDTLKHGFNQQLLSEVLDRELAAQDTNYTCIEHANLLSKKIIKIATALLEEGFTAEAYGIPNLKQNSTLSFNCFTLWEGQKNPLGSIPLTFFVYIWPPVELNSASSLNRAYGSIVHSHPIPCSFSVLQGTLSQKNFACCGSNPAAKKVRLCHEEAFHKGEGDVDDLTKTCIHQLYNNDPDAKICLSLHAYGLSSAEKVMKCFSESLSDCTYNPE